MRTMLRAVCSPDALAILRLAFPEFVERYEHQQARKRSRPIWHALFANADELPAVSANRERSSAEAPQ
jgi:hypothetical protein